jgi:hypothetical protein
MRICLWLLLLAASVCAQARNERAAKVGMRAYIEQLVLPGSELAIGALQREDSVALRIVKVWPHGSTFRYDLEWTGLEPGTYDLRKWLVRKDGSAASDLPPIPVEVTGVLAASVREPSEPDPVPAPDLGGYSTLQIVFFVLWGLGLLAILFVGRKRKARPVAPPAAPTLADRLRPLVEAVAQNRADTAAKAELERTLVSFWRLRLGLRDERAYEAIAAIRRHAEAGELLRTVELWLHAPEPPKDLDLNRLLAPYRHVTADSLQPLAADQEGQR